MTVLTHLGAITNVISKSWTVRYLSNRRHYHISADKYIYQNKTKKKTSDIFKIRKKIYK